MIIRALQTATAVLVLTGTSAALAQPTPQTAAYSSNQAGGEFARFAPQAESDPTRIDYSHWDQALKYFVFRMGRSIREGAPSVEPVTGTRRIYGHDSRYRLEGNRVIFSYFDDEIVASLTEYREDLQRTADQVDITALPRNEQLAFWMNLHNVAVIEQIAIAYPVSQPSRLKIGPGHQPLDKAKFITVAGVAMSPRDIRTRIVYPNWRDPRVIYGFFRGEIGGPSIQPEAFNGSNLGELLNKSAHDFVNSLRGTEKRGSTLHVSKIYDEARPFFFAAWPGDIQNHIRAFATIDVRGMVDQTSEVRATIYEADLSDLAKGETDPEYNYLVSTNDVTPKGTGERTAYQAAGTPFGVPRAIGRLLKEQNQKFNKIIRRGTLAGEAIVLDDDEFAELRKENETIE